MVEWFLPNLLKRANVPIKRVLEQRLLRHITLKGHN